MSSVLANLEANAPMGKAKTTDEKIKAIEDYLVQLLEQFRWTLNNLSVDNFNEKEVVSWLNTEIAEPIQVAIQSAEEDLRTEIDVSAEGVKLDIHREYAVEWVANKAYYVGDIIKRETTDTEGSINVGFYRCTVAHTASLDKKPPTGAYWSDYWSDTQAPDVLHTRFDVTAAEIRSEVSKTGTDSLGQNETLYSRITQNAEAITQEVAASGTGNLGPGENLYSVFNQRADDIQLQVTGTSAPEWAVSTVYAKDDVVKVTTAATSSTAQSITYYKAKSLHTSAAGNMPPNATYWEVTSAPNVNSMIDLNLNGLTLAYDNGRVGYSEWASDTAYAKDSVVSVTTGGVAAFYRAKSDHTSSNSNKPPNATFWDSTTEPDEHNGSYIKLMKDGTFIGGGKVFVKDLDASTITAGSIDASKIGVTNIDAGEITTGTLDASQVNVININASNIRTGSLDAEEMILKNAFTAKINVAFAWESGLLYAAGSEVKVVTDGTTRYYRSRQTHTSSNANKPPNETYWNLVARHNLDGIAAGSIGAFGNENNQVMQMLSSDAKCYLTIGSGSSILGYDKANGENYVSANDSVVELYCGKSGNVVNMIVMDESQIVLYHTNGSYIKKQLIIDDGGIWIKDAENAAINLFSLD